MVDNMARAPQEWLSGRQQIKMLNGQSPVFSMSGNDVYASDVVRSCIDVIATEISKLQPQHVRTLPDGTVSKDVNHNINRIFRHGPNDIMTTKDFLEKIVWLLRLRHNCFIYPTFEMRQSGDGHTRHYTGFFPLDPSQVDFIQVPTGEMHLDMTFPGGQRITIPYKDVIHLRWRFSVNEIMGGGVDAMSGKETRDPILQTLEINDVLLQGLEKGVKASFNLRGIIKIKTMLDDDKQKEARRIFEKKLKNNEAGIMPIDMSQEFVQLKVDPKLIDKGTLDFLDQKILRYYGVPLPILQGDYTDEQYRAFYERTLASLVISLGQAFTKCLFTEREIDMGNEVVFYQKNMMYLSTSAKIQLLEVAGAQGLLTDDEKLAILGYPPMENGEGRRRTRSLNYIDTNLADQYQLLKAGGGRSHGQGEIEIDERSGGDPQLPSG